MSATGADTARPWYERQPERVEWEREQFAVRDLPLLEERHGLRTGLLADQLVMRTELPYKGQPVPIEVAFPFDYPDVGPTVYGPPGLLPRHQQPLAGNFCWAEEPERDWSPEMDAAGLVAQTIKWLFEDMEAGADEVEAGEADMAEPLTGLVVKDAGAVIVPDPYFSGALAADGGTMTLLGEAKHYYLADADGLGVPDPKLRERYFSQVPENPGIWLAFDPAPSAADLVGGRLMDLVNERAPEFFERLGRRLKRARHAPAAKSWVGLTFLEEGPERGQLRRNWLFAYARLERAGTRSCAALLGAQALTLAERQRRTPELVGLRDARVLVIGAGSVGAPLAFELAKAGVGQLDLVDPDRLDVNNSVRHVVSPRHATDHKALTVAFFGNELNPFVDVKFHELLKVGGGQTEASYLSKLVEGADVVVDTTGSQSVSRVLQRHCAEHGVTLIVAGLSAGSHGGEVGVFRPGGPCFDCLVRSQRDKTVPEPLAAPPSPHVTPVGCSHPAFTGAGFDATEIAALAARTVVQATGKSLYPDADWEWAVVNFRGSPRWQSGRLQRHPKCHRCSS